MKSLKIWPERWTEGKQECIQGGQNKMGSSQSRDGKLQDMWVWVLGIICIKGDIKR